MQCKQDMSQKKKMQMVPFDPMMCAADYQGYTTMDLLGRQSGYSSSCLTELLSLKSRMFLATITFWYVNVKCHILLNFIIFLYAYTCKRPLSTCRLHTVTVGFSHEILKMLFFWPNLLPHLPHWSLCRHTISTYVFSFSDILERSSTTFLVSVFQNNLIFLGAAVIASS